MKFFGLIDHPSTIVVAQSVPPQCPVGYCQTHLHHPSVLPLTPLPLDADVVVPGDALLWFLVLVSVGFASLIAPALDAHYIGGVSVSSPLWIVQQMQTQDVWLVLVVRIALTPSAVQSVEVRSRLFECVGSHLVLRGFTRSSRCCTLHCTSSRCVLHGHPDRVGTGTR